MGISLSKISRKIYLYGQVVEETHKLEKCKLRYNKEYTFKRALILQLNP